MLIVSCSHVLISCHHWTLRRMDRSPTQRRPHPAAQGASPTHPLPPSPPPQSPPSTRASTRTPSLMPCGPGTAGKVPSGSAGIWRCRFARRPGMSALVRRCYWIVSSLLKVQLKRNSVVSPSCFYRNGKQWWVVRVSGDHRFYSWAGHVCGPPSVWRRKQVQRQCGCITCTAKTKTKDPVSPKFCCLFEQVQRGSQDHTSFLYI